MTDSELFDLIVDPVNDAPTIELPDSLEFSEDATLTISFLQYINDIDEDPLVLTVSGNENIFTDDINGYNVSFSAQENWNGNETLTITIDDNQGRAVASDNIKIFVNPMNDPPVIFGPTELSTPEETSLEITSDLLDVSDVDNEFPNESSSIFVLSGENYTVDDDRTTITPTLD